MYDVVMACLSSVTDLTYQFRKVINKFKIPPMIHGNS